MDVEIIAESLMAVYVISKQLQKSRKSLINYNGKRSNFTVEKLGQCHISQVIKVNITNKWVKPTSCAS